MSPNLRTALVVLFATSSLALPKLALPAALVVLLHGLSLPKAEPRAMRLRVRAHVAAGVIALAGTGRFLAVEALPGIVQGGTSAAASRAISRLRELLFAEDSARKTARWDPDGDGIGSALLVGELTGESGVRGGARLAPPLLERYPKLSVTRLGPALEIGGYFFKVCLPTSDGGLSADPSARFDDEAAERRFVGYAWPNGTAPGLERAYSIDEHDRILSAASKPDLRRGLNAPPGCDDASSDATKKDWRVWRDKKPRQHLPGDR